MAEEKRQILFCPECGAKLRVAYGAREFTCTSCGTVTHLDRTVGGTVAGVAPVVLRRIRDRSGRALVVARAPKDWTAEGRTDTSLACDALPFVVHVTLAHGDAVMRAVTSNKFKVRRNMPGSPDMAFPRDRDLSRPSAFLDDMARRLAGEAAPTLRLCGQDDFPELSREWTEKELARLMQTAEMNSLGFIFPFGAIGQRITRIYRFVRDGRTWGACAYVNFTASSSRYEGMRASAGNMGLFGGGIASIMSQYQEQMRPRASVSARDVNLYLGNYPSVDDRVWAFATAGAQGDGITQEWTVHFTASLVAPAEEFDDLYSRVFQEFITEMTWDPETRKLIDEYQMQQSMQESMRIQAMGQTMLAQNRAVFDASQSMARSMQSTQDAQFAQYMANSDAQHQAFRSREAAQFSPGMGSGAGYGGGMDPIERFSKEVILEEADYVDEYGDVHTVSSHADRAWIDDAGNVIGTEGWVDPGHDWTEMHKL